MAKKILLTVLILLFISFPMRVFVKMYLADVHHKKSQRLLKNGEYGDALRNADMALKLNSQEPRYYWGRAKVTFAFIPALEGEKIAETKEFILSDMERAYVLNPRNLVTARNLVPLYSYLAAKDISHPPSEENVDPEYVPVAQEFYSRVREMGPNDVGVYALLAKYEKRLGLMDDYSKDIKYVENMRSDLLEWYLNVD